MKKLDWKKNKIPITTEMLGVMGLSGIKGPPHKTDCVLGGG